LGEDFRLETTFSYKIRHYGGAPYKAAHEKKVIPCSVLKTETWETQSVNCEDDFSMGPWPHQYTFKNKTIQWEEKFTQFADQRWGGDHKFTYGFRVEHHDNRFNERWNPVFWYSPRGATETDPTDLTQTVSAVVRYIQPRKDTMRLLGLYAQDEMRVSKRWSFNFGGNYMDQRLTTFGYRGKPYVDFQGSFQGQRSLEQELLNNTGCLEAEFLLSSDDDEFWNPGFPGNDLARMRCMPIDGGAMKSYVGVTDVTKYIPGVLNYVADAEALRFGDGSFTAFFSAVWRPYGDEDTVVRFNLSRQYGQLARYMGWETQTQEVGSLHAEYSNPSQKPCPLSEWNSPTSIYNCYDLPEYYLFDRELDTPFTDEWTVSVARNITETFGIDVRYTNRRAYKQPFFKDINQTVNREGKVMWIDPLVLEETGGKNKNFKAIWYLTNQETRTFESVEIVLTKYMSRNWELNANYSYILSTGVAEDISEFEEGFEEHSPPGTAFLPEVGVLEDDQRHEVNINLLNYMPGDFRVGTIVNWASGLPYSRIYVYNNPTICPFNPSLCGGFLGEGRNAYRNPSHWRVDMSLIKDFEWGESWGTLSLEVENLFNEAYVDDQSVVMQRFRREGGDRLGPLVSKSIFFPEHHFGRSWEFSFTYEF
jgi:outer membrane receptor protein involved in Fe transport